MASYPLAPSLSVTIIVVVIVFLSLSLSLHCSYPPSETVSLICERVVPFVVPFGDCVSDFPFCYSPTLYEGKHE